MKTLQQITSTEVKKHTSLFSVCVLTTFMFLSQVGKSQEMVAETSIENIATVQLQAADTLNPAFEANQAKVDSMMTLYFRGTDDADNNYTAKNQANGSFLELQFLAHRYLALYLQLLLLLYTHLLKI